MDCWVPPAQLQLPSNSWWSEELCARQAQERPALISTRCNASRLQCVCTGWIQLNDKCSRWAKRSASAPGRGTGGNRHPRSSTHCATLCTQTWSAPNGPRPVLSSVDPSLVRRPLARGNFASRFDSNTSPTLWVTLSWQRNLCWNHHFDSITSCLNLPLGSQVMCLLFYTTHLRLEPKMGRSQRLCHSNDQDWLSCFRQRNTYLQGVPKNVT